MRQRIYRRHEQINMAKYATARFEQNKLAQLFIISDEPGLFPNCGARYWPNSPNNYIANFALRMAAYNFDHLEINHRKL